MVTESAATETKQCRFCCQNLAAKASVCHHCNRVQDWWRFYHIELGSLISLLISFALLLLAATQLSLANADRSRATIALEEAQRIRETAEYLQAEQKVLTERLEKVQQEAFSNLCAATGGVFDFGALICHLTNGDDLPFNSISHQVSPPTERDLPEGASR